MSSSLASSAAAAAATPILVIVPPGYPAVLPAGRAPPQPGDTGMTPIAPPPVLTPDQLVEDRGYQVYWAVAMMIVICSAFFGLRLLARFKTRLGFKPSDWILLAGILCAFGFGAVWLPSPGRVSFDRGLRLTAGQTYIWSAKEGAGRHFQSLVQQNPERTLLGLPYKARGSARVYSVEALTSKQAMFVASNIYFASVACTYSFSSPVAAIVSHVADNRQRHRHWWAVRGPLFSTA